MARRRAGSVADARLNAMKNVSLKVEDLLAARLEAEAARRRVSKSEILREALTRYLERDPVPSRGSFAARAARFAGCLEGPPDLSTDPRHLEGFGE